MKLFTAPISTNIKQYNKNEEKYDVNFLTSVSEIPYWKKGRYTDTGEKCRVETHEIGGANIGKNGYVSGLGTQIRFSQVYIWSVCLSVT